MPFFFLNLLPRRAKNRAVFGTSNPSLAVLPGHLVLGGKTIAFQTTAAVTAGHLTVGGKSVLLTQVMAVVKGALTVAGKDIRLYFNPVLPAHLTLTTRSVSLSELAPPSTRAPLLIPRTGNRRATRWRGVPQR